MSEERAAEVPQRTVGIQTLPPALYRSEMLRRFGPLYYLSGLWLFFRKLRMTEPSAERVRQAAQKGPVVYALRTRSRIDYLALNEVLRRRRLPLATFGTAVSTLPFEPLPRGAQLFWERLRWTLRRGRLPHPVSSGWLTELVAAGAHTSIFLRPDPDWRDLFRNPEYPDPVDALLEAQERNGGRAVQVLPVAVIWARHPERAHTATLQALLGTEEDSGSILKLAGAVRGSRNAMVQIGEPVDLAEYLARYSEEPRPRQAKRLRLLLRRYCFQEQQLVRGPRLKSPSWTRRLVLRSARITRMVRAEAEATGKPVEQIQRQVVRSYDRMAARFSYGMVRFARVLRLLWNSLYSGIDVREEDLERIRQAKREGVCVLVPSHKSHLDYVLISSVMDERDLVIPHVVAGDNLAFFPLGALLRRVGALFIKRSFKNDRIFPAIFQAYLTHLFREGYTVEFFIEGGRSRTGKLLPPKLGVLGYTVEAGLEARLGRSTLGEVSWLPVSICYEQIAEERPFAQELTGAPKKKEDPSELMKSLRILGKRFGKVYLRVGEPIRLTEFVGEDDWGEMDRSHQRERLQHLGEQILHRINQVTVVLPTGLAALALLSQSREEVDADRMVARAERYRALLETAGVPLSATLSGRGLPRALQGALDRFRKSGLIASAEGRRWRVVPEKRITLEYYKNSALHPLVPASVLAAEIRSRGETRFSRDELRAGLRFQLFVLRYEFIFDPEVTQGVLLDRALELMVSHGALEVSSDGAFEVLDKRRIGELAELTLNFIESYYGVLRALHSLQSRDVPRKDLAREIQRAMQSLLAAGDIQRPEALSLVNLKNAVRAYEEEQVFQVRSGGAGLELDDAVYRQYVEHLRRLVRW